MDNHKLDKTLESLAQSVEGFRSNWWPEWQGGMTNLADGLRFLLRRVEYDELVSRVQRTLGMDKETLDDLIVFHGKPEDVTDRMLRYSINLASQARIDLSRSKFHEIEIQKVFDMISYAHNIWVQSAAFYGTANLTLVGVAITKPQPGLILFAFIPLVAFAIVDQAIARILRRYYSRAAKLEKLFAPGNESHTFLTLMLPPQKASQFREETERPDERAQNQFVWSWRGIGAVLVFAVFEIILFLALSTNLPFDLLGTGAPTATVTPVP